MKKLSLLTLCLIAFIGIVSAQQTHKEAAPNRYGWNEIFCWGSTYTNDLYGDVQCIKIKGEYINVTPKEFDLLVCLVQNKGVALSRERILLKVWNYDYFGEDRTVDTHIKMLRSHLKDYRDCIQTVWGVGYKFEPKE